MAQKNNSFLSNLKAIAVFVAILWVVLILSKVFPLNNLGIRPRTVSGLAGIIFAPLLHGGFAHLVGNSMGLLILGTILFSVEGGRAIAILMFLALLSGAGTWLIGSANSLHIGASGLIYGMISYLLFYGIFKRSIGSIVVSVVVFVLYGGAVWGVFPSDGYVSWEMHLSGFLAGILLAKLSVKGRGREVEARDQI